MGGSCDDQRYRVVNLLEISIYADTFEPTRILYRIHGDDAVDHFWLLEDEEDHNGTENI